MADKIPIINNPPDGGLNLLFFMTKINLSSKTREVTGNKVKKYRKEGLIPAVIYGHKVEPKNLWVKLLDFERVYKKAGESTIIELEIEGKGKVNVLIHDIQNNPVSDNLAHIDFFQVRMDEKIEADIQLEFVGEAPAVKELGGILLKNISEIKVSCLPADLPSKIEIDISVLKTFEDHIKVKDLKLSEKVKILLDSETTIAGAAPQRTEAEMAKLDEKVEEDVTKVEGVVKETPEAEKTEEGKAGGEEKKEAKK